MAISVEVPQIYRKHTNGARVLTEDIRYIQSLGQTATGAGA